MKEAYKLNKEWLDLLLERKNNENITYNLSNNDIRILLTYIEVLQQENKELKEQLLVTQTNEETFRLEMKDITQTLGLDEDTIFDDVKAYVSSLEVENQKYKDVIDRAIEYLEAKRIREKAIVDIDVLEGILKEVE